MKQRVHARHFDSESFELAVRVDDDALVDDVAYGGPLVAHVKGDESSHGETASRGSNIHNQHSNHDVAEDLVEVTVDEVLLEIGGFGRFQHRSVALTFFIEMVIGAVNLHQIVTERPLVVPFECDENNQLVGTLVDDSSVYGTFQLVCDKTTMRATISSAPFIGFMIGTIFAGWMTDAHGRKASTILACILMVVGTQCWVAPNVTAYMILRACGGMGCGFGLCGVYVLQMELVSRPHRGWIGSIGMTGSWSFGGVVSALVAMNVHQAAVDGTFDLGDTVTEWRAIGLFVAILSFLGLLVVFATTETPTWYLSKGRAADAWDVLDKIAATNGRKGPLLSRETHHLVMVKNQKQNPTEGDGSASADEGRSVLALFSTIPICGVPIWRVTLISMLGWFAAGFCYYGTALNMGNLPGEFYSIQVVQLTADIPALLLSVPMLNRLGSRETVAISLIVGGAATFGCGVITVDEDCIAHGFGCSLFLGRTILGIFGKMIYCITLSAVYVSSVELFPTWATGKGLGLSSLSARIGTLLAPFIVLLSVTQASLPLYIFGVVGVASGFGFCFLPDTSGRKSKKIVAPVAATRPMTGITGSVVDEHEALQEGRGEALKRNGSGAKLSEAVEDSINAARFTEGFGTPMSVSQTLLIDDGDRYSVGGGAGVPFRISQGGSFGRNRVGSVAGAGVTSRAESVSRGGDFSRASSSGEGRRAPSVSASQAPSLSLSTMINALLGTNYNNETRNPYELVGDEPSDFERAESEARPYFVAQHASHSQSLSMDQTFLEQMDQNIDRWGDDWAEGSADSGSASPVQAEQGSTRSPSLEPGPGRSAIDDQATPRLKHASSSLDGGSEPTIEGDGGALPGQPLSLMALGPITEGKLYSDCEAPSNTLGMTKESSGLGAPICSRESSGEVETAVKRDHRSELSTSTSEDQGEEDKLLPDSWGDDWWPERGATRPKQTELEGVTSTPEDGQEGEEEEEKLLPDSWGEDWWPERERATVTGTSGVARTLSKDQEAEEKLLPDSWGEDWWPEGHRPTNRPGRVVPEPLHESWQPLAAG